MRDKTYDNRGTPREEILLIRIGHHLWRLRGKNKWDAIALDSSLETVWEAKRTLRAELREKHRQGVEKSKMNLSAKSQFKTREVLCAR
jgi:hypothetical protein